MKIIGGKSIVVSITYNDLEETDLIFCNDRTEAEEEVRLLKKLRENNMIDPDISEIKIYDLEPC